MKFFKKKKQYGIAILILAIFSFAIMNGFIRYLADYYNVVMINIIRYWFLGSFLVMLNSFNIKRIKETSKSNFFYIQIFRGTMLAIQMCFAHYCFYKLGLVTTASIFAISPLLVTALSSLFLKEKVNWKRWLCVFSSFIGILLILRPGIIEFDPIIIIALGSTLSYAIYQILTRFVSKKDKVITSFFYTGFGGIFIMTLLTPFFYQTILAKHYIIILIVCILGSISHYLIIKAYEICEASLLQPFNYLQYIFIAIIGIFVFDEVLELPTIIGALIIIISGLYTYRKVK